jgi:hypothetical protein
MSERSIKNRARRSTPRVERCEDRVLTTLIFVLNGNAYAGVGPNALTANAARVLRAAGNQVVQLSYPTMATPRAFDGLARRIAAISRGRPIGLVGFSAGGSLASRLSGVESLNVAAVLNNYGPPNLRDWLNYHGRDLYGRYVRSRIPFRPATIDLLSGPSDSKAYVVSAFGRRDRNVQAAMSMASAENDFPNGKVYLYDGGHGAPITASRPALDDFLAHL